MAKRKKDMSWLTDEDDDTSVVVKDSNWNALSEWDSVIATKDLKVKWMKDIKRWDVFNNIRITDDEDLIESGKMVLRTEFFKKK